MEERTDEAQAGSTTGEGLAAEHRIGSPYRDAQAVDDVPQTLVVIGNGMMCFRLCQKLVECGANHVLEIVVFGEEPRPAYDRVHLTELFSGKTPESLTLAQKEWYEDNGIELYLDDPIVEIDREDCIVRSKKDRAVPYHRLVFATGSRPFVPPIAGADLPGVFVYRTVEHLEAIRDYSDGLTSAAVIGGGLLGLEAAKAVYDLGLEVHVVEVAPGLMPRQLDARGAELLKDKIEQLGVRIRLSTQTTRIEGIADQLGPYRAGAPKRAERILHFADGSSLAIDMVVISAGIRPRDELAAASGLKLAKNGGIVVDDHLTSSDPRIFAVGECAVHRGTTYGLAFPGYKMVDVLVDNLVGGTATFESADQSAKLKLMGVSVASMGAHSEMDARSTTVNSFDTGGVYRKLVMRDGKIVGAIAVGEWDNLDRVREAIDQPHLVSFRFWDMRRFRSTGNLWLRSESPPIAEWPEDALVCGCLRVNRGTLSQAQLDGCSTVEMLCARTSAGTMCGSCKPLLAELLGGSRDSVPPSMRGDAVTSSMRGAPRSVRSSPASRRYSQPASSGRAASGPPPSRDGGALGRYRTIPPPSNDPIALVRHTPTPVVPVMAAALDEEAPDSSAPSSDTGPVSLRSSQLPPLRSMRSLRPSALLARAEAALRSEREDPDLDAPRGGGASGPPSARISYRPPDRIPFTESDSGGDDEQGPISVPAPSTHASQSSSRQMSSRTPSSGARPSKVPSIAPSTSKRLSVGPVEIRSMDVRAGRHPTSGHPPLLPPEPEKQGDSIVPPPDSVPPSLRDLVPPSVREYASLMLRDSSSRLMREAAVFSRDLEEEGHDLPPYALRGRDLPHGQSASGPTSDIPSSGHVNRDSAPVSSGKSDSGPPSRRRDSLPPLRPISVPPGRASLPSGRLTAPLARAEGPERGRGALLFASICALLAVVGVFILGVRLDALPVPRPLLETPLEVVLASNAGKQVTGYAAVILGLASLLLWLRKRSQRFTWSDVPIFRVVHAGCGVATLGALMLHTRLHLGWNLNLVLMINFLGLTVAGAGAGGVIALSHWFSPITAPRQKRYWYLAHLILFSPLPLLLALHVLGAYYY